MWAKKKATGFELYIGPYELDTGDNYFEWDIYAEDIHITPGQKGTFYDPPSYPDVEYVLYAKDSAGNVIPLTENQVYDVEAYFNNQRWGKSIEEIILDKASEMKQDEAADRAYEDAQYNKYFSDSRQQRRQHMVEQEYYVPLYRILVSRGLPETQRLSKAADWLSANALRVTNQVVRHTFKKAGRKDLIDIFAAREDVAMGDTVRSKNTGRFGKVVGIHWDDETVDVKWETGGVQPISKGALQKMREKKVERFDKDDFAQAETQLDNYGSMTDKKKTFIKDKK